LAGRSVTARFPRGAVATVAGRSSLACLDAVREARSYSSSRASSRQPGTRCARSPASTPTKK